jgi:hypothetical protein
MFVYSVVFFFLGGGGGREREREMKCLKSSMLFIFFPSCICPGWFVFQLGGSFEGTVKSSRGRNGKASPSIRSLNI